MNVEVKDFVTEKVNVLIHAATCCAEAKEAGKNEILRLPSLRGL